MFDSLIYIERSIKYYKFCPIPVLSTIQRGSCETEIFFYKFYFWEIKINSAKDKVIKLFDFKYSKARSFQWLGRLENQFQYKYG